MGKSRFFSSVAAVSFVSFLSLLSACGGSNSAPPSTTPQLPIAATHDSSLSSPNVPGDSTDNYPPIAVAETFVENGNKIILDAMKSSDPDNDPLIPVWRLSSAPYGSGVETIINSSIVGTNIFFFADIAGTYEFDLFVFDGTAWSDPARVSVNIESTISAPAPNPGDTPPIDNETPLVLDITIDTPMSGQVGNKSVLSLNATDIPAAATYKWEIVSAPTGSASTFENDSVITPGLTPDKQGEYLINVYIDLGQGYPPRTYHLKFRVTNYELVKIDFNPVDAKFSQSLNTLVMLDSNTSLLHLFDINTGEIGSVTLPLTGQLVDVSADGLYAAVSHDAYLSYVDLQTRKLVKMINIPAKLSGLALLNGGIAVGVPAQDQWSPMYTININTSSVTENGWLIYAGSRLAQQNGKIYYITQGLSPADISRVKLDGNSQADLAYDSKYHGDYAMCGNLWLAEDASRLATECLPTFRTSDNQADDIIYAGSFTGIKHIFAFTHSKETNKILISPDDGSTDYWASKPADYLVQYSADFLGKEDSYLLPWFNRADGSVFKAGARWVFFNDDGTRHVAIMKIDDQSGLIANHALAISR